jgi:mono/diheme cytochrome c family protein
LLLSDLNGPTRDAAQQLLVERADPGIVPQLIRVAKSAPDPLGRLHALWTLEGMEVNARGAWLAALEDPHPQVQIAALRILQSNPGWVASRSRAFVAPLRRLLAERSEEVQFHAVLAGSRLPVRLRLPFLARALQPHATHPLFRDAALSGLAERELEFLKLLAGEKQAAGYDALFSALAAAVVRGRQAGELSELLAMSIRPVPEWQQAALRAGIGQVTRQADWQPVRLTRPPTSGADEFGLFAWPGHDPKPARVSRPLDDEERRWYLSGREQFIAVCAACHGVDGQGLPSLAPPLAHSEWVLNSPEPLIRIVLHGMEGPVSVNGVRYAPPLSLPDMPALRALDDSAISGILTYIRRAWDHAADPVAPQLVARVRQETDDRDTPYTAEELMP